MWKYILFALGFKARQASPVTWCYCVSVCSLFGNIQEEVVKDSESVRAQQHHVQQHSCTLDECFELYTKEEQVTHTKTHIVLNISSCMPQEITTQLKSARVILLLYTGIQYNTYKQWNTAFFCGTQEEVMLQKDKNIH